LARVEISTVVNSIVNEANEHIGVGMAVADWFDNRSDYGELSYPLVMVAPESFELARRNHTHQLTIVIVERISEGRQNLIDGISKCHNIAADLYSSLAERLGQYQWRAETARGVAIEEQKPDRLCGVQLQIPLFAGNPMNCENASGSSV